MLEFPDLRPVLTTLQWAVIGGVATRLYMPERATQDLDIVVRREDGGQARATLAAAGIKAICRLEAPLGPARMA